MDAAIVVRTAISNKVGDGPERAPIYAFRDPHAESSAESHFPLNPMPAHFRSAVAGLGRHRASSDRRRAARL